MWSSVIWLANAFVLEASERNEKHIVIAVFLFNIRKQIKITNIIAHETTPTKKITFAYAPTHDNQVFPSKIKKTGDTP